MKIDAKIRIIDIADNDMLKVGDTLIIPIDQDYIEDYDDVIQEAENYFYTNYGMALWCNENFVIVNSTDICDDISDEFTVPD